MRNATREPEKGICMAEYSESTMECRTMTNMKAYLETTQTEDERGN